MNLESLLNIEKTEFPKLCYACGEHIEKISTPNESERGQFVVHKESAEISGSGTIHNTSSIPLCAECTEQIATIIDHWPEFKTVFNQVEEMND